MPARGANQGQAMPPVQPVLPAGQNAAPMPIGGQRTKEQREEELQRMRYGEVKRICVDKKQSTEGGKIAMIGRILTLEFPLQQVPPPLRQVEEEPPEATINKEWEANFWKKFDQYDSRIEGRFQQLERALGRQEEFNDFVLNKSGGNSTSQIQGTQAHTSPISHGIAVAPTATSVITAAKKLHPVEQFWPDRRLRNFDYQEEYDEQIKMERMISSIRTALPNVQGLDPLIKPLEDLVGLRAAKLRLADTEGEVVARGLVAKEEGTFMEQFEPRIEKLKKSHVFKRNNKYVEMPVDNRDFGVKKRKQVETIDVVCFNCGEKGHKRNVCSNSKKGKLGNGQISPAVTT
jgi:hypothetical protein